MKIKPIVGGILGLAVMATIAAPANAQRRFCVVDDRNEQVVCGREATEREIRRGRADNNRYDRNDRFDTRNRRNVERRITQLYVDILGRRPDRGGLRTYSDRIINDGWDYDRVRRSLARSSEARRAIERLYDDILGRRADRNGIETYQGALERGWTLTQVREDLLRSRDRTRIRR